jgi:acyl carrier protein
VSDSDRILDRIVKVMQTVFTISPELRITRETSALDIAGWDSLSHSLFILEVEGEFAMDLPLDKTYEMQNIGDLVDLIAERSTQS